MTVSHHVTVLGERVSCVCGFDASSSLWEPGVARQIGFAHLARPEARTYELLAFVTGRAT